MQGNTSMQLSVLHCMHHCTLYLIRKPKLLLVNNGRPCYQKSKAETFIYTPVKDLNHTLQIFGLRGACFFPKHGECSSFNFLLEHLQVQG